MTRGKIAIIVDDNKIKSSVEFNGDMYCELNDDGSKWGNGWEAIELLQKTHSFNDFGLFIDEFNSMHYDYEDGNEIYTYDDRYFDFINNYFDKWFSDYVYLKNLTDHDQTIMCQVYDEDKGENVGVEEVIIKPNGIAVVNFGSFMTERSIECEVVKTEKQTFDGYWEMTENGILIRDTDNDKDYSFEEVDDFTREHIIDYIRDGYIRGDLCEVFIDGNND